MATVSNDKPHFVRRLETRPDPRYVHGVVLLDLTRRVLAFDEGAADILRDPQDESSSGGAIQVPREILDVLLLYRDSCDERTPRVSIQVGSRTYNCSFYSARSMAGGLPSRITVLHLARDVSMDDALISVSTEYRLTAREQEALRGILGGLTSKELAEQMNISPNTVKAYLRLVMGKMGVSSRTAIVAKLFEPNGYG